MNRKLLQVVMAAALMLSACTSSTDSKETEIVPLKEPLQYEELSALVESHDKSSVQNQLQPLIEAEIDGFPLEIVNQLREAVYRNNLSSLLDELDDQSRKVSKEEIISDVSMLESLKYFGDFDSDSDSFEHDIYHIAFDDGQGLLMLSRDSVHARLFRQDGEGAIYADVGSVNDSVPSTHQAFFEYGGDYYLAAGRHYNYGAGEGLDSAVLYQLQIYNNEIRLGSGLFIHNQKEISERTVLYTSEQSQELAELLAYLDHCLEDLIWVSGNHQVFFGDEVYYRELPETIRSHLPESFKDHDLSRFSLYAVDIDNDLRDEYFLRINAPNQNGDHIIQWYDEDFQSMEQPFDEWNHPLYNYTNIWFKRINGKILILTLYQKDRDKDSYLIDAKMLADGETTIMLEYLVRLNHTGITLTDSYIDGYQQRLMIEPYQGPEQPVLPDDAEQLAEALKMQVKAQAYQLDNPSGEQSELTEVIWRAILSEEFELHDDSLGMKSDQIDGPAFYQKYCSDLDFDEWAFAEEKHPSPWQISEIYESTYAYAYRKELDEQIYYLVVYHGENKSSKLNVYQENQAQLTLCNIIDLQVSNAMVLEYSGDMFLIKKEYPDQKENYLGNITVSRLGKGTNEKEAETVMTFSPKVTDFRWEKLYGCGLSYEQEVGQYIDAIKSELMQASVTPGRLDFYTGDEVIEADADRQARLKSFAKTHEPLYYIDFNNDGQSDYLYRRRPANSTDFEIAYSVYRFVDNRVVMFDDDMENDWKSTGLIQLWYKEIDGKVFTFELFIESGDYYGLNVSLIEGDKITQVQSYLIMPELKYRSVQ